MNYEHIFCKYTSKVANKHLEAGCLTVEQLMLLYKMTAVHPNGTFHWEFDNYTPT